MANKNSGTYYISVKLDVSMFGYVESTSVIDKEGKDGNIEDHSYIIRRSLMHQTFSGAKDEMYAAMLSTYYDIIAQVANQKEMQNLYFVIFETGYKNGVRSCDGYFIPANNEDDVMKDFRFFKLYKQYNKSTKDDNSIKTNSAIFNFGYVTNENIEEFNLLEETFKFKIKTQVPKNNIIDVSRTSSVSVDDVFALQDNTIKSNNTSTMRYIVSIEENK